MDRYNVALGRLEPKDRSYEMVYPMNKIMGVSPLYVESILEVPPFTERYNQLNSNACTGFAASWMMSIYNWYKTKSRYDAPQKQWFVYDPYWLYHQAQINDLDPRTFPDADNGSYVWAAFWVLRHVGHQKYGEYKSDLNDGLINYFWGHSVDDGRKAISTGRPFCIGVNWYDNFSVPELRDKRHWIGIHNSLGNLAGGHAICVVGASDPLQAFLLQNSWGSWYPQVWMPYKIMDRLMRENGEMCVGIDNPLAT